MQELSEEDKAAIMNERRDSFLLSLKERGEADVRAELESDLGFIDFDERNWVREWLHGKAHQRLMISEPRADEALRISARAAHAAENSARWPMWSAIIALSTTLASTLTIFLSPFRSVATSNVAILS